VALQHTLEGNKCLAVNVLFRWGRVTPFGAAIAHPKSSRKATSTARRDDMAKGKKLAKGKKIEKKQTLVKFQIS
jgi:hypothetical protein